jgi:hypothetical protein
MDIRQVKAEKPNLGGLAEARFRIIHNLRIIDLHEPTVARFLQEQGAQKMATKKHFFTLSTNDGKTVDVTMTEPKSGGQPFMSFPEAVRLFCIEIDILFTNQQYFVTKTEDEILQVFAEMRELAPEGELFVEQGRNIIQLKVQDGSITFQTLDEPAPLPACVASVAQFKEPSQLNGPTTQTSQTLNALCL